MNSLRHRLKAARIQAGISQHDLGQRIRPGNFAQQYVQKVESGNIKRIGHEVIEAWAKACQADPAILAFGRGNQVPAE